MSTTRSLAATGSTSYRGQMHRTASGTSSVSGTSAGTATSARRGGAASGAHSSSKAKDLLRDYYGLNANAQPAGSSGPNENTASAQLDLDSESFSPTSYMNHLLTTSTLPQLLRASTTISGSIADLESERQSLVYNHHHELIDASITISKMKVRAESLETTLEQLKASLSRCAELESSLKAVQSPYTQTPSLQGTQSDDQTDWQYVLDTLLDLPIKLEAADRAQALRLWGTYEPVLRRWKEAGVKGVQEFEADCREVVNNANLGDEARARRRSSVNGAVAPSVTTSSAAVVK